MRIQARAIARCGELMLEIAPASGERTDIEPRGCVSPRLTRKQAAKEAGLSDDQRKTALRVASIPKEQRDALIESEAPPTVTQLAEIGKQSKPKPLHDLEGINPALYARATNLQGSLRRLAEFCGSHSPTDIAGAFKEHEKFDIRLWVSQIETWIDQFIVSL